MAAHVTNFVTSHIMRKLFEEGLWLEKKIKICGRVAETRLKEIIELE